MDPVVVAAIIGGCAAVAAPVITLLVKKALDERRLRPVPARWARALPGNWDGTVQEAGLSPYKITLNFELRGKLIKGTGTFETRTIEVTGSFYDDRFLRLDYKNKDPAIIQYGLAILELLPTANKLEGKFLGYGPIAKRLVAGGITLEKAGNPV